MRRATWSAPELPAAPDDLAAWARERGLPRRVFARSPLERKPKYVDFESASLRRSLVRFARGGPLEFTEMLPEPGGVLAAQRRGPPHERAARRRARDFLTQAA